VQDVGIIMARYRTGDLFRSATHQGYQSNRSETPSNTNFGRLAVPWATFDAGIHHLKICSQLTALRPTAARW